MIVLDGIQQGFALLGTPSLLAYLVVGLVAGFVVGVLPGFGSDTAAAVILPFSIGLGLEAALVLIAAIYAGTCFAGAIPATLMNIPGTPGAAATALDGYPMARAGKAKLAIAIARTASTVGGVIGMLIVFVIIGPLSNIALAFGTREMLVVALLGLSMIAAVMGDRIEKGLLAGLLGLLVASMSASPVTAEPRLTFGFLQLYDQVPFISAVVGLFAFAQVFFLSDVEQISSASTRGTRLSPSGLFSAWLSETAEGVVSAFRYPRTLLRGGAFGALVGVIPAMGAVAGNFGSYALAKRASKHPEEFGKGSPEGIVASESADNAVAGGAMVPTMVLGIPGSGTAAMMLVAIMLHGITPGPRVMQTHTAEVYATLLTVLFSSLLILPLGIILSAPLIALIRVPVKVLGPCIVVIAAVGAFAVRNSLFDVGLAFVFGVLGVVLRLGGYPVVPVILGMILGPIVEENLMRGIVMAGGDWRYFFGSPLVITLWILLLLVLAAGLRHSLRARSEELADFGTTVDSGSV